MVFIENLVSLLTFLLHFVLINKLVVIFPLPFRVPGKIYHLLKLVLRVVALVFARPYMLMMIIFLSMPTLTGAVLTEIDVRTLLSWSRRARLEVPHVAAQVDDAGTLSDEFAFVPELVLAILLSLLPNVLSLRCLLYTSPSPRDRQKSRMPSSA